MSIQNKTWIFILFVNGIAQCVLAQNPYKIFDYSNEVELSSTIDVCMESSNQGYTHPILVFFSEHFLEKSDTILNPQYLFRFFSIDPLYKQYAHNAPYAFSENKLIDSRELEGLEAVKANLNVDQIDGSL